MSTPIYCACIDPQYLVKLTGNDDVIFSFGDGEEDLCTVIVSLMQKDTRERIVKGEESVYMRFDIFKVNIHQKKILS